LPSFIRHPKDFWTGIIFLAFGIAAVYIARDYSMGQAAKMGPGYFPTVLGGLLILIGAIGLIRSFIVRGEPIEPFTIKGMVLVLVAVLLFGFLVRPAGLVVAQIVMIMLSAYASTKFRWVPSILLAIGLTIFSVVVFVYLLGLPIPVFGPWFGM
jgi:hypothetical protein